MLFAFPDYQQLASAFQGIAGLELHEFSTPRYDNQEMHAAIPSHLAGERCFILGSIAPPDEQFISFTLLSHTLREHGAGRYSSTHGLFTGEGWRQLWSLNVKHISCTNTIPPSAAVLADNNISILSMAPLLREAEIEVTFCGR
jgi:phosphoribosylpyrophosphate synthetase